MSDIKAEVEAAISVIRGAMADVQNAGQQAVAKLEAAGTKLEVASKFSDTAINHVSAKSADAVKKIDGFMDVFKDTVKAVAE